MSGGVRRGRYRVRPTHRLERDSVKSCTMILTSCSTVCRCHGARRWFCGTRTVSRLSDWRRRWGCRGRSRLIGTLAGCSRRARRLIGRYGLEEPSMLYDERTLARFGSVEAGPMPEAIGAAVARRRVARRVRRVGLAIGCLVVVGGITLWGSLPGQAPHGLSPRLVDGNDGSSTGVRFARGSLLALRMAGLEDDGAVGLSRRTAYGRGEETLYSLRERALAGAAPPAS